MAFHVGQKVVCVDDSGLDLDDEIGPERGAVYTIRSVYPRAVLLVEIVNRPQQYSDEYGECRWRASRFRPLIERKHSTSTGFEILDDIRKRETFDEPVKKPVRAV